MKIGTHEFADPVLRRGKKLVKLAVEYFPENDIDLWLSWDQAHQNKWVRDQFLGRGVVFGEPREGEQVETHHLRPLGMGHKDVNNWPGVMIPVIRSLDKKRSLHSLLEAPIGRGMKVVHWDPLDPDGGLEVVDLDGSVLKHEDMWFYNHPSLEKVNEALEWKKMLLNVNAALIHAFYALGPLYVTGADFVKYLGAKTVSSWFGQNAVAKTYARVPAKIFDEMYDYWEKADKLLVPPFILDFVRRRVPESERPTVMQSVWERCSPMASNPSMLDFIADLKEQYPTGRTKKITIVPPGVAVRQEECSDPATAYDDLELDPGSTVVKGWPVGT